ncbi:4'-phosphopantetheinyl transferase family protein [Streptacidiphilus sp. PAMC 29251]
MNDAGDRIDLWVIRTDQPAPVVRRLEDLLDRSELDRAEAAVDPVRANRFTALHGIVRLLTAQRLDIPAAELVWSRGRHGKPAVAGADRRLQLSYSASGALAVLALTGGRPVGVDVEELRDGRVAAGLAGRYFPVADQRYIAAAPGTPGSVSHRFTRLWCRREARVKVHGGRSADPVALDGALDGGPLDVGPCLVRDVPVPGAFRAAVAAAGERPFQVRQRFWTAPADLAELDDQYSLTSTF